MNGMGKPGIPRYVAVLKGMDVCSAKVDLAEHDVEYWRAHPEELQRLVERIRTGMRALHEAGYPEWGTAIPVDAHRLHEAQGWTPGQYIYDEIEEKAVAEAFKEKGEAAWDDPRVTGSKWYKDYIGEQVYWQQERNRAIQKGEEILGQLGFRADGSAIASRGVS